MGSLLFSLVVENVCKSIAEEMERAIRTLMAAYRENIGDNLSVDSCSPDKIIIRKKRKRADFSLESSIYSIVKRQFHLSLIGMKASFQDTSLESGIYSIGKRQCLLISMKASFQDTFVDETHVSKSTAESGHWLTIKAKGGGDTIMFPFYSYSGFNELSQQVSRRLNLEIGTYVVKYQDDEKDWILITCDDDLHLYISSSMSQGKYTLRISIESRKASLCTTHFLAKPFLPMRLPKTPPFSCNKVISRFRSCNCIRQLCFYSEIGY